jgi:hypothetical protein
VKYIQGEKVENEQVTKIKHVLKEIEEWANHSRSVSVGGKLLLEKRIASMRTQLEIIELHLMMGENNGSKS